MGVELAVTVAVKLGRGVKVGVGVEVGDSAVWVGVGVKV